MIAIAFFVIGMIVMKGCTKTPTPTGTVLAIKDSSVKEVIDYRSKADSFKTDDSISQVKIAVLTAKLAGNRVKQKILIDTVKADPTISNVQAYIETTDDGNAISDSIVMSLSEQNAVKDTQIQSDSITIASLGRFVDEITKASDSTSTSQQSQISKAKTTNTFLKIGIAGAYIAGLLTHRL